MTPAPTRPPGPADTAAEEHLQRLRAVDRTMPRRTISGLLRDLAEGDAAQKRNRKRNPATCRHCDGVPAKAPCPLCWR